VPLLLLAAVSMGLSNFAGAIGIGVSGVDVRTRLRVGVVFGLFEGGMPLIGLLVGHTVAHGVGGASRWIAAGLLVATGVHTVVQTMRSAEEADDAVPGLRWHRLLVTGLALSIDNLAVGFALGAYQVNVLLAALLIACVSVGLSLIGLELGAMLGARAGARGELLGGVVLVGLGAAIAAGLL